MSYVAMHYVRIGNRLYSRGEIIDEPISADKAERLTDRGAIRETNADRPFPYAGTNPETKPGQEADAPGEAATGETEAEAEPDEEPAPPEIDAMDGIVQPAKKKAAGTGKGTAGGRGKA